MEELPGRKECVEVKERLETFMKKHANLTNAATDKKYHVSSMQQILLTVLPPLHRQVCEELGRLVKDCHGVDPLFQTAFKPSDFSVDEAVFAEVLREIGGMDCLDRRGVGLTDILDKLHFTEALTNDMENYKTQAPLFDTSDELVTLDSYYHSIDDVLEDLQRSWLVIEKLVERDIFPAKRGVAQQALKFRNQVLKIAAKHVGRGGAKAQIVTPISPTAGATPVTPTSTQLGWTTLDPFLAGEVNSAIREWKDAVDEADKVDPVARFTRILEALNEWEPGNAKRKRVEQPAVDTKRRGRKPRKQSATPEVTEPSSKASTPQKSPQPQPKRKLPQEIKQEPIETPIEVTGDPVTMPPDAKTPRQLILPSLFSNQGQKTSIKRALLPRLPDLLKQAKVVNVTGSTRPLATDAQDDLHSGLSSGRGVVEFEVGVDMIDEEVWDQWFALLNQSTNLRRRRESGWNVVTPTSPAFAE
jgi:hypothetical protein